MGIMGVGGFIWLKIGTNTGLEHDNEPKKLLLASQESLCSLELVG
jgi:hypothetical protein